MKALLLFAVLIVSVTVSAVYSLMLLDNLVHGTLYNYGLQFSYDWATPYWALLRTIQALMGLSALFALTFTIYVYRKYIYAKPQIVPVVREEPVSPSIAETQIKPIVREEVISSVTEPQMKPNVSEEVVSSSAIEPQIKPIVCTEVVSSVIEPQNEPIVREEQVISSAAETQIVPVVRETQIMPVVREEPVSPSATEPQPQSVSGSVKCAHCGKTFSQLLRRLDFSADKPRIVYVCPTCNEEINLVIRREELDRVEKAVQKKKRKGRAKVVRKSKEALEEQPKDETKEMVTVQAC